MMTEEELRAYKNCLLCGSEMKPLESLDWWDLGYDIWEYDGYNREVEVKACTICGSVRMFKKEQECSS